MRSMFSFFVVLVAVLAASLAFAQDPVLQVGDWVVSEEWHNWIGGAHGDVIPVYAHMDEEISNPVLLVEFDFSLDFLIWTPFAQDEDGHEPPLDTFGPISPPGDGWYGGFDPSVLPPNTMPFPVYFRATGHHPVGPPTIVETWRMYDPGPPDLVTIDVDNFDVIETEIVAMTLTSISPLTISEIIIHEEAKQDTFFKGVPGIDQRKHSDMHCAPTAAAQCLKYFENQGDTTVTGGLADSALVEGLSGDMKTTAANGTSVSNWVKGITKWIKDHGDGYTVRHVKHRKGDGTSSWTKKDWETMRDELERCQDVLTAIYWDGGGGHAMTFNSVVNDTTEDGKIKVDFKDPWTAETEWGEMDPATGQVDNMSGAGGGGGGTIGHTVIICPKETDAASGGPGPPIYQGPNPPVIEVIPPYPGRWWYHITVVNDFYHAYRLIRIIDYQPNAYVPRDQGDEPDVFYLNQSEPNPFRERTVLRFAAAQAGPIGIDIYDVEGRHVRSIMRRDVEPGFHSAEWDGRDSRNVRVAPGIYYARMVTRDFEQTRKLIVVR